MDELVKANLKFVISIAKEYQGQGLSLSDLISEGNLGLVRAATKFDHTKGFKFISYAVWWIKESILKSLTDNARTIRLPSNLVKKLSHLKKQVDKFKLENEREPIYGDLLDENGEVIGEVFTPICTSLNEVINENGDELSSLLQDDTFDIDTNFLTDNRIKNELTNVLSQLDDREREIIECYFGIDKDFNSMTLDTIGEKYNLSKERVRQIKERAIRKLRHNSEKLFNIIEEEDIY
jgi:RNA polymerase primary sigma factor